MKSKLFFVVALVTVLFTCTIASAQGEEITLSTYYPAPYGEYDELCAEKLLVDTPAAAELQDMARGDCHITNSLIVGAAGGGFSYDEIGGSLADGTVLIKGDVGIGTTNPGAGLQPEGATKLDIRDAAADGDRIYMRVGSDGTGAYPDRVVTVGYMFPSPDDCGAISAYDYTNNVYKEMRVVGSEVSFWTAPSAPGAQKRMSIDVNGNVGIGTTTPQNRLDVEGGAVIGATYSGTNTAPGNGLLVEGNVGIGTTSPSEKLDVDGKVKATGLVGCGLINRGDPTGYDFWQNLPGTGYFICDDLWHDLNLSSIVPEGAKMVLLFVAGRSGATNDYFKLRENGNSGRFNISSIWCPGNGVYSSVDAIVPCDSNRVIEYQANGNWPILVITVKGWWK